MLIDMIFADFYQVVAASPNDKDAKNKMTECGKIVRKMAFEKAIAVEDNKKCIAETLDLNSIGKDFFKLNIC